MRSRLAVIALAHPMVTYTLARVVLFLAVLAPLALVGMRGLLLLAAGILISGMLSLVLLDPIRNTFGGVVGGFFQRMNRRIDEAARAEDDDQTEADPGSRTMPADYGPGTPAPDPTSARPSPASPGSRPEAN